jgi:hypothetical protein
VLDFQEETGKLKTCYLDKETALFLVIFAHHKRDVVLGGALDGDEPTKGAIQ